jgi:AcrR family transcriptional regulator
MEAGMKENKRVGRPKGSSKEDTLAKIMPVARRIFADKGFAQATFKDIGTELGISHAALYSYFPSKKELYIATVADAQSLLLPFYMEALENGKTLKERISYILMATAKEHDKDSSITGLLAAVPIELHRHPELFAELQDANNIILTTLHDIFVQAQANGEIASKAPAEDLVAALLGGGVGVALFQYGMQKPNLSATMQVFVDLIDSKLFA